MLDIHFNVKEGNYFDILFNHVCTCIPMREHSYHHIYINQRLV